MQEAQQQQLAAGDAAALGAGEDTVYRDKRGRKLEHLSNFMAQQEGKAPATSVEPTWGRGLAQERSKEEQRAYERAEAAKPVARYEIDADRDSEKRAAERWGDPMLGNLSKKAPGSNRPRYRGPPAPPNRFNLEPGSKWDGVDRSNGYEKAMFLQQADARLKAATAHAWATEDM